MRMQAQQGEHKAWGGGAWGTEGVGSLECPRLSSLWVARPSGPAEGVMGGGPPAHPGGTVRQMHRWWVRKVHVAGAGRAGGIRGGRVTERV